MAAGGIASVPTEAPGILPSKLECAILSALVHFHGRCDESLWNWFLALESAFPWLKNPDQVRVELKRLWVDGIVELEKAVASSYSGRIEDDRQFFLVSSFSTVLTAKGAVRWDSIRRWPKPTLDD